MNLDEVRRIHRLLEEHVSRYFGASGDLIALCRVVFDLMVDHCSAGSIAELKRSDIEAVIVSQCEHIAPKQQLLFGRALSIVTNVLRLWTSTDQMEAFLSLDEAEESLSSISTGNFAVFRAKEELAPPCAVMKPRR